MKIIRKIGRDGTAHAWHAQRETTLLGKVHYDQYDRYACKRFIRRRNAKRMELGDLRNLKKGDRVCRDCADQSTQLAQRIRFVHGAKIGLVQ